MQTDEEHLAELSRFPLALQLLIKAELAAGNSVVEFGHSFPAPPVGAYCKLSKQVSSRARVSDATISFYDRNSSIYSGEFTDSRRYFFVLEPPHPTPSEPDMDAIRDKLQTLASSSPALTDSSKSLEQTPNDASSVHKRNKNLLPQDLSRRLVQSMSTTSAEWTMHFRDAYTPDQIQEELEEQIRAIFTPFMSGDLLKMTANTRVVGAWYVFELCYEAALADVNCYRLNIQASWGRLPENTHEYFHNSCHGWIDLWIRNLHLAEPPNPEDNLPSRYKSICDAALTACARLDSVDTIQNEIIEEVKRGATFSTAHKEGGTTFFWRDGRYVRSDYGEYPGQEEYQDDPSFLKAIKQFFHWDINRNTGDKPLTDVESWKLLYRILRR